MSTLLFKGVGLTQGSVMEMRPRKSLKEENNSQEVTSLSVSSRTGGPQENSNDNLFF